MEKIICRRKQSLRTGTLHISKFCLLQTSTKVNILQNFSYNANWNHRNNVSKASSISNIADSPHNCR
jgi:hypothetical protein